MAVTRYALEVGVELEVLHRVLVVAFQEADPRDLLTDDPEDPERDLVLVGAHHLDPAPAGLEHGRVVDPHPVGVGDARLLVGIDGADVKPRVAPAQDLDHVLGSPPLRVLCPVEIGELHVQAQTVDDVLGLLRGREDPLAGEIEVGVVEHEGHVGEGREAERRHHDADHVAEGWESPEAGLQGEPKPEPQEDRKGDEPAPEREEKNVGKLLAPSTEEEPPGQVCRSTPCRS